MKKRMLPILIFFVVIVLTITVYAAEPKATTVVPTLTFSGTTAQCKVTVTDANCEVGVTMELWCGSTLVDSWSDEGTSRVTVEGSCRVTKGKTYTLKTYGTVDGARFTGAPVSKTC